MPDQVKKDETKNVLSTTKLDKGKEVVFADVFNTIDNNNGMLVNEINRLCGIIKTYTGKDLDDAVRTPLDSNCILSSLDNLSKENVGLINYLSYCISELESKIK